ncbi:MAG: hypothetical protein ACOCP8_04510 [archaeon]
MNENNKIDKLIQEKRKKYEKIRKKLQQKYGDKIKNKISIIEKVKFNFFFRENFFIITYVKLNINPKNKQDKIKKLEKIKEKLKPIFNKIEKEYNINIILIVKQEKEK